MPRARIGHASGMHRVLPTWREHAVAPALSDDAGSGTLVARRATLVIPIAAHAAAGQNPRAMP